MPLLDHFHPPLALRRHWESFHVNWAGAMADLLNEQLLPEGYFAEEHIHQSPRVEVDVATYSELILDVGKEASTATIPVGVWTAPPAAFVLPATFPDRFEVLVFDSSAGATLVAAIELVSPGNKDREATRRAFAIKCASDLQQGVSLIVIDIVSNRLANLHNETMSLLGHGEEFTLPADVSLYAVAYRPVVRGEASAIDVWPSPLAIGRELPVLPLALNAVLCLPLDLETTYTAACQRRRLA